MLRRTTKIDPTVCYECSKKIVTPDAFTMGKYTNPDVTLQFCSDDCLANYAENCYMEAEEDYYCGEREVDSDPYDRY